jgi:hypothetical protein
MKDEKKPWFAIVRERSGDAVVMIDHVATLPRQWPDTDYSLLLLRLMLHGVVSAYYGSVFSFHVI